MSKIDPSCDQHAMTACRTMRQGHRADDCHADAMEILGGLPPLSLREAMNAPDRYAREQHILARYGLEHPALAELAELQDAVLEGEA
jgi:hypothetical protein